MPYLTYLRCENCGDHFSLDVDMIATIESYRKDGRPSPQIVQATLIWDYMIYSCNHCKTQFKYTYQDVERRVREYFSRKAKKYEEYFKELTKYQENEQARRSGQFFVELDTAVKKRIESIYSAKK